MIADPLWRWLATILAVTVGVLVVHAAAWRLLLRPLRKAWPRAEELRRRCYGPTRLLAVTAALLVPVRSAPRQVAEATVAAAAAHGLLLVLIGAAAWLLTRVMHVATDVFLVRHELVTATDPRGRRIRTQVDVLRRATASAVTLVAVAAALLTFDQVRTLGASLLASAGVVGVIAGIAARSTIGNLVAGLQIAFAEPIRLEDVVVVEGEWGQVEEITLTYVVVRIWDQRRLILPTTYFIDQPFENWTRSSTELLGTVTLHADYTVPVEALRQELERIVQTSTLWNRQVAAVQVVGATERTVEVRALVSADTAADVWDLRCDVREKLLAFLQREHPAALPRVRAELTPPARDADGSAPSPGAGAQRRGPAAT